MLVHLLSVHNEPLLLSLRYAHTDKDVQTWQVFIAQDQVAKRDVDHHITTRTLKQGNTRLRDTINHSRRPRHEHLLTKTKDTQKYPDGSPW